MPNTNRKVDEWHRAFESCAIRYMNSFRIAIYFFFFLKNCGKLWLTSSECIRRYSFLANKRYFCRNKYFASNRKRETKEKNTHDKGVEATHLFFRPVCMCMYYTRDGWAVVSPCARALTHCRDCHSRCFRHNFSILYLDLWVFHCSVYTLFSSFKSTEPRQKRDKLKKSKKKKKERKKIYIK